MPKLYNDAPLSQGLQNNYKNAYQFRAGDHGDYSSSGTNSVASSSDDDHSIDMFNEELAAYMDHGMEDGNIVTAQPSTHKLYDTRDSNAMGLSASQREKFAERRKQEEMDEEIARQILSADQERASVGERELNTAKTSKRCSLRRLLCAYVMPIAAMGCAAAALVVWYVGPENIPIFWGPNDFFDNPNSNSSEYGRWESDGKGLTLQILNAVDQRWQEHFYMAIVDWDGGIPDALTLNTIKKHPEKICSPVDNAMKVCNGDYGDTGWKGINEVLINQRTGFIEASVSKMNDFYFSQEDEYARRYTMCHEIGHGFGVPHTDENFNNRDLGNCMDYTHNFKANMSPDVTNFRFLADLYGIVPGSKAESLGVEQTDRPSSSPISVPSNIPSLHPTVAPTFEPSTNPSKAPTSLPTTIVSSPPSPVQTTTPSFLPTSVPSDRPSVFPTSEMSNAPTTISKIPSEAPTSLPTASLNSPPSSLPTTMASFLPSSVPSGLPSEFPTSIRNDVPATGTSSSQSNALPVTESSSAPSVVLTGEASPTFFGRQASSKPSIIATPDGSQPSTGPRSSQSNAIPVAESSSAPSIVPSGEAAESLLGKKISSKPSIAAAPDSIQPSALRTNSQPPSSMPFSDPPEDLQPTNGVLNRNADDRKLVSESEQSLPNWILEAWQEARLSHQNGGSIGEHEGGVRTLHRNLYQESYELEIGQGYAIQIHQLL